MKVSDLEIIKNGTKYRVNNNSITGDVLTVDSFNVDGLEYIYNHESIDGINGRFLTSKRNDKRKATLLVSYNVEKMSRAQHLKGQLAYLFSGEFFVREMGASVVEIPFQHFNDKPFKFEPNYLSGKTIKLQLNSAISFDVTQISGQIAIEFETVDLPYYESIGRSLDLASGRTSSLWSSDMLMDWEMGSSTRKYVFENVKTGTVYYHGTYPIEQFNQECKVSITLTESTKEFNWYTSASDMIEIKGLNLKGGDVITFDGLQTYRNNVPINEYTRLNFPKFNPGANTFKFNQKIEKVVFDLKFYYL
ncbi:phage tail protein [Mammaliicoccus sciuri]|uniref:phage tail protein n=1 Tax=Mammaliicoccus sciuri TaxID=1296 RepID=UPI0038543A68